MPARVFAAMTILACILLLTLFLAMFLAGHAQAEDDVSLPASSPVAKEEPSVSIHCKGFDRGTKEEGQQACLEYVERHAPLPCLAILRRAVERMGASGIVALDHPNWWQEAQACLIPPKP